MFQTLLVQPIYNCFIFILGVMPNGDVGLAIIALTLLVRGIFYPVFTSSIRTQMAMQAVQPELADINEKYKDNAAERSRLTAELFTRHRIRPFALIISTVVQIAFFIALSYAFFRLNLPRIHTELLYPFVHAPAAVSQHFLGFFDLTTSRHIVLTVLVVALQYAAIRLTLARTAKATAHLSAEKQAAQQMQRRMMLYLFPAMMAFLTYTFPGAIGVYMATSTGIAILQELHIRKKPL